MANEYFKYLTIFKPKNTVYINRELYAKMLEDREKYTPELIENFLLGKLTGDIAVPSSKFPLIMADYGIASSAQLNGCCDIKWDLLLKLSPNEFAKQISLIARKIDTTYPFISERLRQMSIQLQKEKEEQKNNNQEL